MITNKERANCYIAKFRNDHTNKKIAITCFDDVLSHLKTAFLAGAKEAYRMIPIKENLPNNGDLVLVETKYGSLELCVFRKTNEDDEGSWDDEDGDDHKYTLDHIKSWRYI